MVEEFGKVFILFKDFFEVALELLELVGLLLPDVLLVPVLIQMARGVGVNRFKLFSALLLVLQFGLLLLLPLTKPGLSSTFPLILVSALIVKLCAVILVVSNCGLQFDSPRVWILRLNPCLKSCKLLISQLLHLW